MPPVLRARSLIGTSNPALFRALLRRLNSGLPVNILAVGSSLVASAAGCTAPLPLLDSNCTCPRCCGTFCGSNGESGRGWAVALLRQLNRTWPHAEHTVYNMGEPGGDVLTTLIACPRSLLAFGRLDLVLLDVTINSHQEQERAVRQLLRANGAHSPPPALVLPLFSEFTDRKELGRTAGRGQSQTLLSELVSAATAAAAEPRRFGTSTARVRAAEEASVEEATQSGWRASGADGRGGMLAALVRAWHTGNSTGDCT